MKRKFFAVAAVFLGSHGWAQTDTATLNDVVVTANKFEQKQNTTGKVITIITKEQIDKSSGKSLTQLLNEQGSIVINGALNNAGSVQTVFMRGASTGRTLILMDGIPVNDASEINNNFDLNFIQLANVERIEICKGAQSTLYGSDAVAGVINIITTKKGVAKPANFSMMAAAGNYGTFKGNIQAYGKSGKLNYSGGYNNFFTKGFSSAYDSASNNNFDKDGYNNDALNALVQYQIAEHLSVKTFANYSRYNTDADEGAFNDDRDYTITDKNLLAGTGLQFKNNRVTLTGNYRYGESHRNYLNDSADVPGFTKYVSNKYFSRSQFAELYASIYTGAGFIVLAGGDYRYGSMNQNYVSVSGFGPYEDNFSDTSASQFSLYGSVFYSALQSKLNIEAGGRWNKHSQYGSNATYTFNPSYRISKHYRIFGSIASAFKAPTLYQLYVAYSGNKNLKPEKSTNYEIGFQEQHPLTTSRLVFFYRDIKDGIDYDYVNYQYFNFVQQVVRGFEYEIDIKPVKNFSINANYTYISAQETTQDRIDYKETSYHYLLRRPKHNLNITAGYTYKGFYASLSGKYVSSRYDIGGYQQPDVLLDSYFLLGAYTEYKFNGQVKIFVDAQNITNKKFFDVLGFNAIPFLFTAGVHINF
ncbi:MAG TPA: TonB-dependent receptor [Chitinophagaceae bacterium]|nr:TonB-dependent receptor [Chitinophagaceae bacterium]